jgi:N-acetylglutamate synthase-like GNAT family acetyltransferase
MFFFARKISRKGKSERKNADGLATRLRVVTLTQANVHADHQSEGIATALLQQLEKDALAQGISSLWTEASITAQPFFAKRGFETIAAREVEYEGQTFRNYRMRKKV